MDLPTALSLHQAGRRAEAAAAYQAILARAPGDPDALHGFGVLLDQQGQHDQATALITRAIAARPNEAVFHFNLGLSRFRAADYPAAIAALTEAARLAPGWAQAQYDLGNALREAGDAEAAIRAFRAALKLKPDYLEAEVNLANVLRAIGKREQAVATYRRVLRRRADLPEVHSNLAAALLDEGDLPGAQAASSAALALRPGFPEALSTLAQALVRAEKFAEALEPASAACAARPDIALLHEVHAGALAGLKRHDAALAAWRQAEACEPGRPTARFGEAEALRQLGDRRAAEAVIRGVLEMFPNSWQAHHELGSALREQGRFTEAEPAYRRALALSENVRTYAALGTQLRDLQRLEEAEVMLRRAVDLAPTDADAQYNLAILQLSAGRLADGFARYDWRFERFKLKQPPGQMWKGEAIRGKRLLVSAEQGLGDTIQFVRYVPALQRLGAKVTLLVGEPLTGLLAGFPGVDMLIGPADGHVPYDVYCRLMSLPRLLRLAEPRPLPIPYLHADPVRVAAWRARLAELPRPWVGLTWAGNPGFVADHLRSVPADRLGALAGAGASFVSLQKGATAAPGFLAADWTAELATMADTAALVAALDLVISVDSAVAHLAGALGQTVWLLNRFDSCWRWRVGTEDCIWYPSLRQFRQQTPGDWDGVLARVATALRQTPPYRVAPI